MPDGRSCAQHADSSSRCVKRRSDGGPCRGHPLDHGKSDQTQAGFLARGSRLGAWPSQASHDLASGPVADPAACAEDRYASRSPLTVAGTAADSSPHSLLSPLKGHRSEEHTSELQSLMRISYAVFCLKKKKNHKKKHNTQNRTNRTTADKTTS